MSDKTTQDQLNDIAVILFDSPFKLPLSLRKDFIMAALIVLLARWPLCYILLSFISEIQPSMNFSDESWAITVLLSIPVAAIFFCAILFRFLP